MKVVGIVGSPRKGGNTEILIAEAMESAREAGAEVETLNICEMNIAPCQACDYCINTGECKIKDDMQNIYPKLLGADGIIIGTPVYFWNVSGQIKVFMDRTSPLASAHRSLFQSPDQGKPRTGLRGKVGGVIVVTRRAGATSTFNVMRAYFRNHHMIEAGGAIAYANDRGEVRLDEEGMKEARRAAKAVVRTISKLNQSTT